ncbi:bifunctional diaminohydroxyphosphoribosylaminopyrimidine deaminase/5-amino-6-(5-phosphoribosylamino)uracil reductase RibD [Sinobacterium norvegicum]|nr:bifunctional diaminohydroxyphosphoribosylaminopyrimidine deaminase/5-amino-6-(5-phosphoribosylamino)uracil reductase RibD [Sinobacterium norvegicum]
MTNARDQYYMAEAIALAKKGLMTTSPNPRVGCVLVKDDVVVGRGYHLRAGEGHAEVNALADAGVNAQGCTAYVTLEPCSHTGRTGPCCQALANAGVARVVVAMQDPNPQVGGSGLQYLRDQGIAVDVGVLEQQARALNPGFIRRMTHGLPLVTAKLASSVDGRTAMASGESQWITGPAARTQVQQLRARSCAIITGIGSILLDDSSLTLRRDELGLDAELSEQVVRRQPIRVVLDSRLRMPLSAKILRQTGRTIIAYHYADAERLEALSNAGAELVQLPLRDGHVDGLALLRWLAEQQQCNEVLLETGSQLAGGWLQQGLIDRLKIFMAPKLLGSQARPLFTLPLAAMSEQVELAIDDIRAVGDDWLISAAPVYSTPL